jgi:hypothetical protein
MPKAETVTFEQALAALDSIAESDADKAKVKGVREWVCRKLGVPFHEVIEDKVKL